MHLAMLVEITLGTSESYLPALPNRLGQVNLDLARRLLQGLCGGFDQR